MVTGSTFVEDKWQNLAEALVTKPVAYLARVAPDSARASAKVPSASSGESSSSPHMQSSAL